MANKRPLASIGTVEYIDLPDDELFAVPAKIDTGADYSAIWASNVELRGSKLYFNFFAPGSPYYRPEPVMTTSFKATRVKNSFGDVESRYKIKLRVRIGQRTFRRWFSLADRSRSTYPVLLGKNFLKNTFLVDVSKRHVASNPLEANKILVLGAGKSQTFFDEVQAAMTQPAEIVCATYDELVFYLDDLATTVKYLGAETPDIASFSFVYMKSHNHKPEIAAAVAEYLNFRGRRYYDKEVGNYTSMSKLSEYMKLTCGGVAIPRTMSASNIYLRKHYAEVVQQLGKPFVLKEIASDRGRNNYLISKQNDFAAILQAAKPGERYVAQAYVENDGFYRIYIVGKKNDLIIWRASYPHQDPLKAHLNKPSGSANASEVPPHDVPAEVLLLARQAADCLERQVAGVDLVQDKHSKEWYVLEVNNAPQLRSGSFIEQKIKAVADFFDKELNR